MIKRILPMAAGCAMLAACTSTPYQNMGFTGGVKVEKGADGTILVRAMGNGYTVEEAMLDYAMLKAAELTKEAGEKCFEVISANSQMDRLTTSGQYGPNVYDKPSARVRFKVLTGVSECPDGNAEQIIARLRPKVSDPKNYPKRNGGLVQ